MAKTPTRKARKTTAVTTTDKKLSTMLKTASKRNITASKFAPNVIVNALAGTGKTFTLVVGIAHIFRDLVWKDLVKGLEFDPTPSPQQAKVWDLLVQGQKPRSITYIAFNKSIVEDFTVKWKFLTKALDRQGITFKFSTIHSLGYAATRKAFGYVKVNKWRTRDLLEYHLGKDLREVQRTPAGQTFVQAVEKLVKMSKLTLVHDWKTLGDTGEILVTDEGLDYLSSHYAIDTNGQKEAIYAAVNKVLNLAMDVNRDKCVDFDDQIWLPVVCNLPVWQSDFLLVDEGQDTNRCQQAIALKAGRRGFLVGDTNQAIYGFAGADVDSIPRMTEIFGKLANGVTEVPLTVTRRCGKAIVREAQRLVPEFEAHEDNHEGLVNRIDEGKSYEGLLAEVDEADFVLCRVNAPLVRIAFAMLKRGRKANIQGRDLGDGLKALIKKSKANGVTTFLDWLEDYHQKQAQVINKRKNVDEEALIALADRVECLRTFADGSKDLKEMTANIDMVFTGLQCPCCKKNLTGTHCFKCKEDDGSPVQLVKPKGVLLSSIHRAKGLEADRVFVLKPGLLPHPMASSGWQRGQERNLEYVAITRAIKTLTWVDED